MTSKRPNRLPVKPASVHSMQQALSSLAVPAFPRTASLLQQVPEYEVVDLDSSPTLEKQHAFQKNHDWNTLQRTIVNLFQRIYLEPGELSCLHDNITNLLGSKAGLFLFDYFKQELLPRGMNILKEDIDMRRGKELLLKLEDIWQYFFKNIIPSLEVILYLIKTKGDLTVRQSALVAFRDIILLEVDIEDALESVEYKISPEIKQMFLIVYAVIDTYPPNRNKLKLESLLARIVVPFLGYRGLYEGDSDPVIPSNEPVIAAKRKSLDWRRISRPLSVQPKQLETLNELFLSAIRKQQEHSF